MRYVRPFSCAIALLALLPACFDSMPDKFSNLAELNSYEKKEGYVIIEHFGDSWPARVLTQRQYHDKVNVILATQEPHVYDDYDGYDLRVVTLKGQHSAEIVAVYRTKKKR